MKAVAVLLLLGIVAVVKIAAGSSAGISAKDNHDYEKHGHGKKHVGYKPDGYKPDGYKPDGYKSDGYKSNGYKPGYEYKDYKPDYGAYGDPDHYYGEPSYGYGKEYKPEGYDYDHSPLNGYYGEPSPYDGGYFGGDGGRQIIHLQAVYNKDLVNTTLIDNLRSSQVTSPCAADPSGNPQNCNFDYALVCALRHHDSEAYGKNDYSTGRHTPIFQTAPVVPTALGKGYLDYERVLGSGSGTQGLDDMIIFNGHQKGYKWAEINGYMKFAEGAQECHPLLGPNTLISFNREYVPVFLIVSKVQLPVDPAVIIPIGGYDPDSGSNAPRVSVQGTKDSEYKITPEGNKYKITDTGAYLLNEKDNTLCGLSLVARGKVSLVVDQAAPADDLTYQGTIQWPLMWSDLVTTLPLLVSEYYTARRQIVEPGQGFFPTGPFQLFPYFQGGVLGSNSLWLTKTLDRMAAICKANDDIPWVTPATITLDVRRV